MSDLFKEMCSLAGKMSEFSDEIKDKEEKNKFLKLQLKVTELCKKIADQEFDENDELYLDTISIIMDTGIVIKEFKENQVKFVNVLNHIIAIIYYVEKILEFGNEE